MPELGTSPTKTWRQGACQQVFLGNCLKNRLLVTAKSVCTVTSGIVSVSVDVLFCGMMSVTPAGGVTVAVLLIEPVALGLTVAVTV